MIKYKLGWIIDRDMTEEPLTCDCCDSHVPVYPFETNSHQATQGENQFWCEICSSAYVTNWITYPQQHSEAEKNLGPLIAKCTNEVLSELGRFKGCETFKTTFDVYMKTRTMSQKQLKKLLDF